MSENNVESAERAAALRQFALTLRAQLTRISRELQVELSRLGGSTQKASLEDAPRRAHVPPEEMRQVAQSIVLDAKLREHDQQALAKARPEPETLREWWAALASGQLVVAMASAVGATASRIVQLAIIAGLVGLSAHAAGTGTLLARARTVELTLLAHADDAALAEAAAESEAKRDSTPVDCETSSSACADDAITAARLRVAFRSAAALALQQDMAGRVASRAATLRQDAFRLGAVDARRAILAQAERPAAPSADPGAERLRYDSSPEALPLEHLGTPDALDEAFERRVETLRAHEPTWRRARAWAVHPVPADVAGDAFLRTVLGDVRGPVAYSFAAWSEQASTDFARELIRSGDPEASARALTTRRGDVLPGVGTLRDRRLFSDYSTEVPERVHTKLARYDAGLDDPGSLHLRAASSPAPNLGSAGRRDLYEQLFPAVAEGTTGSAIPGGGGVSGGGGGGVSGGGGRSPDSKGVHRAGSSRVAARSFSRIRFSGKVGGVVFGRPPEPGGKTPDIVALRWRVADEAQQLILSVAMRDGTEITLGPFHPAIVHHALAYAADGRVVVSTLPQPYPEPDEPFTLPARRVLVHPTFEDTAFACNAIQIDRFVDTFTSAYGVDSPSKEVERIQRAREGVTALGQLLLDRTRSASAPDAAAVLDALLPAIHALARVCTDDLQCFPMSSYAAMGFRFGSAPLFLDCIRSKKESSELRTCMEPLRSDPSSSAYSVDSGVREEPYTVDPQLTFVSGIGHEGDGLWPIEFMIQVVPLNADGSESDIEISDAQDPWQFPKIADDLRATMLRGISEDPGAREIFQNVRGFVGLQRFFRTALDGDLGESFPRGLGAAKRRHASVRAGEAQ